MKEGIQNILDVDQFHFFETSQLFICPLDLPDDFYIRASQHQIAFASQDPKALHMAFGGVDATKIAEAFQLIKNLPLGKFSRFSKEEKTQNKQDRQHAHTDIDIAGDLTGDRDDRCS